MSMKEHESIDGLVLASLKDSRDMMFKFFGTNDVTVLGMYAKVFVSARQFSPELMEQVVVPILQGIFDLYNEDPKSADSQRRMLPFVDAMALSIQDAQNIIIGELERQKNTQKALSRGNGKSLVI